MSGALRISVFESKPLQATLLAVRAANKDVQAEIRKYTKAEMVPDWKTGLAQRAQTDLERSVLVSTAGVTVSNQNVTLTSATKGRKLSGGLDPKTDFAPVEFGADPSKRATYDVHGRNGKAHQVTRHTQRQFAPNRRSGYVVYPTAAVIIPRFASLWVQTCIRTIMDAVDGKGS